MKTVITLKVGSEVLARIGEEFVTGKIVDFGTHNGEKVADLDTSRFVYLPDIIFGYNVSGK